MGATKTKPKPEILQTADLQRETWEGALALAKILDFMVEEACVDLARFKASLDEIGVDSQRVVAGLVQTGLVDASEVVLGDRAAIVLGLTRAGRLAVIHATSCL